MGFGGGGTNARSKESDQMRLFKALNLVRL
jgi:hypothetical protein